MSNLPRWPGASAVYSYLYIVLERMGRENYRQHCDRLRKAGRKVNGCPTPTEDMRDIIDALNRGDEHALKVWHLRCKTQRV